MAGAVAVVGFGMGAAAVSAYSISGGSYTSDRSGANTFKFGGGLFGLTCPITVGGWSGGAVMSGSATGVASTDFTPVFGNCKFLGFPANLTQLGAWRVTIDSGPDLNGYYYGNFTILAATTTTVNVPIAACTVTVAGPQGFSHGGNGGLDIVRGRNWTLGSGVDFEVAVHGISFTTSGSCPFSGASDSVYSTGVTAIPGITIS